MRTSLGEIPLDLTSNGIETKAINTFTCERNPMATAVFLYHCHSASEFLLGAILAEK